MDEQELFLELNKILCQKEMIRDFAGKPFVTVTTYGVYGWDGYTF